MSAVDDPTTFGRTRLSFASEADIDQLRAAFQGLQVLPVSVLDEASLEAFCSAVWALTGLIRVHLRKQGIAEPEPEPLAMARGSTVADVADAVHHDLGAAAVGARIWGPSARFAGQRVGRDHHVEDGDAVEILG